MNLREEDLKGEVQGNLNGLKSSIIAGLEELYSFQVPRDNLVSKDLLERLVAWSAQIGREIAIYVNRRGQVLQVAVGDHATVELPATKERRSQGRLCGIRCIHTHPEGSAQLSSLDFNSLASLRLDCMAAVGIENGVVRSLQAAYLEPEHGVLARKYIVFDLAVLELDEHPFYQLVCVIEKQLGLSLAREERVEERAILVTLDQGLPDWGPVQSLAELAELARTAGAFVMDAVTQRRTHPDASSYVGQGKAKDLGMLAQQLDANLLIFDAELSPAQIRNLETLTGCKILDRTGLILDIFAQRAKTREGKIQVELAQLQYLLPRLTGFGEALSRLGGRIGTRGPGESKLETDRRHIRRRINDLQAELTAVKKQRTLQRTNRQSVPLPVVALVGYTNAGKSTLLNTLTNAGVLAEDKLFATLDPVTRRLRLPGNREILLTDTVGFVRRLPHHLVAAFRATLEEVVQSDLLLHVVDASHPGITEQMRSVDSVLQELGAAEKPGIMVFNKVDKSDLVPNLDSIMRQFPNALKISAATGAGLAELMDLLVTLLPSQEEIFAVIPFDRGELLSMIHQEGQVMDLQYQPDGVAVKALVGPRLAGLIKEYTI